MGGDIVAMKPEELKAFLQEYAKTCKEIFTVDGTRQVLTTGIFLQLQKQGINREERHILFAYLFDLPVEHAGLSDLSIEQLRAIRRWIGAIPAITSKCQRVYLPRNEFEDELQWALVAAKKGNKNENE